MWGKHGKTQDIVVLSTPRHKIWDQNQNFAKYVFSQVFEKFLLTLGIFLLFSNHQKQKGF
jgi:hypothetical protein